MEKYHGFGINNQFSLNKGDIVGILKKSDRCGNPSNRFVDNGMVKGIVDYKILTQCYLKDDENLINTKISDGKSKNKDNYLTNR